MTLAMMLAALTVLYLASAAAIHNKHAIVVNDEANGAEGIYDGLLAGSALHIPPCCQRKKEKKKALTDLSFQ